MPVEGQILADIYAKFLELETDSSDTGLEQKFYTLSNVSQHITGVSLHVPLQLPLMQLIRPAVTW